MSKNLCHYKNNLNGINLKRLIRSSTAASKLSPYDVSTIIRANEYTEELEKGAIKSFETNQLASNSPIEDSRTEASCVYSTGFLSGIFDGHAGPACSQVASKRLLRYIAASILPPDILKKQIQNGARSNSFLRSHNDKLEFVAEIKDIYERSFFRYTKELIADNNLANFQISNAIENAFLRLDKDLSDEAINHPTMRTMSVAMSGAVAIVAHIDGPHLHVASTGDCSAVLGTLVDKDRWVAKKLNVEHNSENIDEVKRILSEHPNTERDSVIRGERLLGQLAPLRALGDFRYKWSKKTLSELVVPSYGENVIAHNYYSPPYLTAKPDITYHKLTPNDRFLVLASDGLWDTMTAMQSVQLVGEHLVGKAFLHPLELPKTNVTLGDISNILSNRKIGLSKKPLDKNGATHLIRNALGGTEYGVEHSKLSHMLSLPQDVVRLFRDDITITVIYFDQEFLVKNQA